ncbi:TELO2-interacting protein 1 homolog [Scleropages formosus]|nr:TELO2-interacting protein 1 homolog [Scleropages formosus]
MPQTCSKEVCYACVRQKRLTSAGNLHFRRMSQIDNAKVAFAFLRPACVLLTREQSIQNVQQLNAQLREVSDLALQQLQEYVLFPLRFVLKTPGSKRENLIQAVVEGIEYVLSNTCVHSWDLLQELFSELCLCLSSPGKPGKPASVSEDLKAAVIQSLDALLHAAYGDIALQLYKPVMLPGLGAAISLLLALAEEEKSRKVQAAALKCLLILLLQCDCKEPHLWVGQEESCALATAFACFLPGITQVLTRVITGDMKQGHAVTVKAIKVWYRTVGLVMADEQLSNADSSEASAADLGKVGELLVKRTQTWVKETSEKVAILLKRITSCVSVHQHWKVRLEMVNLSENLLSTCQKSLKQCISNLLEVLVGKLNDENSAVRDKCSAALEAIALRNQTGDNHTFNDILSENLHSLATSLPRLMRISDDQHKLFILNVFLGYLKVLGPKVAMVLNSAAHLQRISKALMQVLELDITDVRIVEERSSSSLEHTGLGPHELYTQKKHFVYFTDANIFSSLQQICRFLGYYGNLYLLVDHFMDLYRESSVYRKQCALVLNEIISGAAGVGLVAKHKYGPVSKDDLKAAVMSIIEEYTSLNNWHLPTNSVESDRDEDSHFSHLRILSITNSVQENHNQLLPAKKSSTVHQMNSNIWQICIQLEGIGCFAVALGVDFRLLLMTTLYPVLEKAGDETLLISHSALCSLWDICRACGYSSLKELINMNSDYLLNDISLNLQRLSLHPHAPRVLAVMFYHSDASLLPLVGDVVQDVLTALDLSYDERAPVFCAVLHSLVKALVRWFPAKLGEKKYSAPAGARCEDPLDVRQFLLDYHKLRCQAEGLLEDEGDTGDIEKPSTVPDSDEDLEDPDKKPELPSHITMAKDVLERCIHLLSDPSLRLRLKVLDVLELCVCVLQSHEDVLLPLVHRCWPALLQRLTNDDPLAVLWAIKVLCTLGETCGDFLRKRVSQEVLPRLTGSLLKQAPLSAKAGPIYAHTLAFKLQLAVLEGLGTLCLRLDLADSDLDLVSEACLPYLSCRQPARLQEACLSVFRHLIKVDPDAVWFMLNELYCPRSYEPPHSDLHAVRLAGMGRPKNEYTDNILRLLAEIH